jgi:thymidylate kinase
MVSRISLRCAAFRLMQLLRRNGLEVGLIGVDGTGKSTLASGLAGTSLPVRAIYMGDNQFTSWPMKLVRRGRLPWPLPVLAMHYELLRRRLRGRCLARRGYIVVYDRHPAERSEPFPSGLKQRLNRWLARGYDGAVDLTFYLTGDFDVLFRRKGEARAAQLREMDARLRSILQQRRISYEQIDATSADTPEVLRQVTDAVIAAYAARADIQRLPSPLRQVLAGCATPVALRNDSDRY